MLNLPAADFFERTTDCVMVLDPDWRVVFGNEHAIRELGIGGLVGRNLWECFPEAVGSIFDERYRLAIANQASETFETFFAPLNSWYEVHAVPAGSQLTVFFRNITERHDALEAAQSRRRALDALFGQAFIGIAQFDAANRTALANDHFCRIVGRTETQLAKLTLAELIHPDDLADHLAALQSHRRSGEPQVAELRLLRPDGSARWCSVNISFMRHEAEAPSTIIVAEDITERRAASAKAATLLATIIDSAQDSIFVKDFGGRFVLVNRALEQSGLNLLGRRVEDVFPPETAAGYAEADRHVLETGKSSIVEESLGVLYYKVPGSPIGFGDKDKAKRLLKEGLAQDPAGLDSNYFYGDYLLGQGDKPGARAFLQKALRAPHDAARPVWDAGRRREVQALLKQAQ